jgi:hypothetical protein
MSLALMSPSFMWNDMDLEIERIDSDNVVLRDSKADFAVHAGVVYARENCNPSSEP